MSDAGRKPDEIERDIEETRAALRDVLVALDRRLSPERIVGQAAEMLEREGSRVAGIATETARRNPVALGLVGTGIALMAAGIGRADGRADARPARTAQAGSGDFGPAHADYDPRLRPTSPGLAEPEPPMADFDDRMAAAERAALARTDTGETDMNDPAIHPQRSPQNRPDDTTPGATSQRGMGARARHSARAMRDGLRDGLDRMPEEARHRVVRARLAAIEAQHEVERRMRLGAEEARRGAREHPLMLGVVALGLGAAIGAALPRTSTENHAIGAHRDRLMDEADRVFREEATKLRHVAEAAVAEGKAAVKDTLESGPPTEDDPARRVAGAAKSEAKRQKVGSVR
jgi:hypothetical protein